MTSTDTAPAPESLAERVASLVRDALDLDREESPHVVRDWRSWAEAFLAGDEEGRFAAEAARAAKEFMGTVVAWSSAPSKRPATLGLAFAELRIAVTRAVETVSAFQFENALGWEALAAAREALARARAASAAERVTKDSLVAFVVDLAVSVEASDAAKDYWLWLKRVKADDVVEGRASDDYGRALNRTTRLARDLYERLAGEERQR